MAQYCKKPVVIEAFQMTPENRETNAKWPEWLNAAWNKERDEPGSLRPVVPLEGGVEYFIQTLEGSMRVDVNDWIIQGVKGELYPCKPDIFEATYEAVAAGIPALTTDQLQAWGLGQSAPMTPEQFQALHLQSPALGSES